MGASDSKLVFKRGIFKLSESQAIAADDPYWASFWELPESAEDIFSLFSPADIRRTRDTALENLETLVLAVTSRLFILRHHPSFPDPEFAPEKDALNCIRVLTRILPFVYEAEQLQEWEDKFFWGVRRKRTRKASLARDVLFDESQEELAKLEAAGEEFEEVKPLAEELIDTLIDLLFFADFTLPKPPNSKNKVSYAIWSSGVGCNTPVGTSKEFESNRTEILRLLLTLTSQSMYLSANMLPVQGVKAISYIVTCPDKQVVLSVLCSLLNTTLKYNPASWKIPYNVQVFKDPKLILVTYSLQFLLVVLLYSIPESDPTHTKKNYFRHFLGRLHRPQDFQFITEGITRVLNYPLHASTSYITGNQQSNNKLTSEMIMFFWEMTQCNKRFRSFIIETNRSHDFLVLIIYYAIDYKLDTSKQGIVRMCVFILQTLSVEPTFGKNLNKKFENQETLPPTIRLQNFNGAYADFIIHSIYNIITTSQGKLSAIYPALLAIINNVAAYLENISASASSKLLQLFSLISSPGFLLANDSNHDLLTSLLESMNAIIEHQYSSKLLFLSPVVPRDFLRNGVILCSMGSLGLLLNISVSEIAVTAAGLQSRQNPNFIYAVLRNKKRFEALRHFTLESGQQEIERRNKRQKKHANANDPSDFSDSRRGSADSLRSPTISHSRAPELSDVPEEGTFAIGDDEDDDDTDDDQPTPAPSPPTEEPSRASSISDSVDDAVPTQLRGMSEKARGKMPAGMPTFSRQNSTTSLSSYTTAFNSTTGAFEPSTPWIETWLPELPLHTLLTLISQLSPLLPPSATSTDTLSPSALQALRTAHLAGIEPSAIRIQYFEWSPLSLGWYESLLWSFVFLGEMQVQKGTVGVWNGSHIKLFRVEAVASMGPTLSSPRGAVDAVGSNIVSRIGSMNLRGSTEGAGAGAGNGENERERVREREVRTGTGEPGVGTGLGGRSAVI
ncbi:Ubp5-interacting protein [Lachnellula hyalina]|uniref:Ubp5-interacting protein n=1 Tax=Lachnellula hyalina TaxID=1316788 RepID=A0A8H8R7H5_9HELO|nr:Ubp5-interacting protein [Lachnellula hyalina]TVY29120.1 Ubp5-interacting protein [Lachnellula hyalina]